eukprot:Plantae.Rhodophyta-Rhodochaete_pulchella.ctg42927.p2 GENE.Plantae.Rhodophyta-Rhodochaete_pulchella.ctg42927~~Plantae.Rhodophyta-Rhodochaete_pulchella.ctg42927.p2  ORF type:complete len:130 (-),score=8.31 Plantae.Rhodophyta-Rhodochaete_pulchella.ctg42927:62-415(-)
MGKFYCGYCDVFLTHDSPAVRRQHSSGNRHKLNVCEYYRQFIGEKTQRDMDRITAKFNERLLASTVAPTYSYAEAPPQGLSMANTNSQAWYSAVSQDSSLVPDSSPPLPAQLGPRPL